MVEVIAIVKRGKIKPVFSHLKNLIFLLITFIVNLYIASLKLLELRRYIKLT